nr:phage head closure protein [Sphingomonas jinjuensis]
MRHQLVALRATKVKDGKGGFTEQWTEIARPWAEVTGLGGRESVMNKVLEGVTVVRVRMWHRDDIDAPCRLRHGDRLFDIRSIDDPFGTRRELLIVADDQGTKAPR